MCIPLLERAIEVAESIPLEAHDRENRIKMNKEAVARMQKQIDDCKYGQEKAREQCYSNPGI